MAKKLKTTVTFTLSFISSDDRTAVRNLLDWMHEYQDEEPTVNRDCESGKYRIEDHCTVANSFEFENVAELVQKYGTYFGLYELVRAVLDCGTRESVTAKSETIEVEED
jgi:hypothetical protein